ncbi:hypothetical protein PFLmoz3_03899 [Pseudomonas fluorescens]|uniref:Uncharacterized protein n=1 Tax=Pseudomonas fluorescens TaxID=294 RepID=A0A109LF50_PSEFL|nr:hypothetical protein PFLmoz3_03899 [Pseudomonas fluorescens]
MTHYLLPQLQQAQEQPHGNRETRHPSLVVHHAYRVYHLQPGLPRPRQLRLRRRVRHGRRPDDHARHVFAARCAVFPWLLFLPGAGGDLRAKAQRQETDLRQPDPLGRLGDADWRGVQRLHADRHPLHARGGRGRRDAGHAGVPVPLVHPCRTLTGQHVPDPRQPGHHAVDVGGVGLPGAAFQLALDVHHRGSAGGVVGVYLVEAGR